MGTRTIGVAGLTAVALLAFSGCASGPDAIDADTYHELAGEVLTVSSDEELDTIADELCGVLTEGTEETSWLLAVKVATDAGMDAHDAGKLIRYAASYRCPDMLGRLPS